MDSPRSIPAYHSLPLKRLQESPETAAAAWLDFLMRVGTNLFQGLIERTF